MESVIVKLMVLILDHISGSFYNKNQFNIDKQQHGIILLLAPAIIIFRFNIRQNHFFWFDIPQNHFKFMLI